jgi:formate hydrogenlyase subunit 3/multisubunit Na+/H+ antiporter MnhD subunit
MNPKSILPLQSKRRILPLILGIVIFGVLMGIREDLPYRWQRILAAAAAGGIIAVSINTYRKTNEQQ